MMAALFLIYLIAMIFIVIGFRITAMVITLINLVLSVIMFINHITVRLDINL